MRDVRPEDLLAAFRDARGPTPAAEARLWQRLQRDVAAAGVDQMPAPAAWRGRAVAVAVVAFAAAAAIVLAWPVSDRVAGTGEEAPSLAPHQIDPETRGGHARPGDGDGRGGVHPSTAPPDAAPPVDVEPPATTGEEPEPTPRAPASKRARVEAPAVVPAVDSLAEETQLVRRARAELGRGRAGIALAILRDHAARFPGGVLAEEADAVRTMARCRMNPPDPVPLAEAFEDRHADSLFARQVRNACGRVDDEVEPK